MKLEDLDETLKVLTKYGVTEFEFEEVKLKMNPVMTIQSRENLQSMDKREVEEMLYAST